jgi:CRP/FNR family transcriptional regulator, cyclic AMP receptor protein
MEPIAALASSPLFQGVSSAVLKKMAVSFVSESWPKRCQVSTPSGQPDRFRIIVSGRVKITRSNGHDGRELTLWLLGPGDGFDIVSLLDGAPHAASAWTLDEVQTLYAPADVARMWLECYPAFRLAIHRYIAQQLRKLTDLASDLALHDTMTRLANLLLRHYDTRSPQGGSALKLLHDLPQEELAALIGSVRVVVSRLLSQLRRQSVAELSNGVLHITDLKRLLQLAEAHLARTFARSRHDRASGS